MGKSAAEINLEIIKQGDAVRNLKAQKAARADIDSAVKLLLALKAEYRVLTNTEWKPGCVPADSIQVQDSNTKMAAQVGEISSTTNAASSTANKTAADVNCEIVKQGNLVRDLKAQKSEKAAIDSAVKQLLVLKADYKTLTNTDWKPGCVPPIQTPDTEAKTAAQAGEVSSKSAVDVNCEIVKQGNLVRDLKAQKAEKANIESAVKQLLALKAEYKSLTNTEWKPGCVPPGSIQAQGDNVPSQIRAPSAAGRSAIEVNSEIVKQGDIVRDLKAQKADRVTIDDAVKLLLTLKAEYKTLTNTEWKPGCVPPASVQDRNVGTKDLDAKITAHSQKVRKLKSEKTEKSLVEIEIKKLLELKEEFKVKTGKIWTPTVPVKKTETNSSVDNSLAAKIIKQADKVRELKSNKAAKSVIDAEVKQLMFLKDAYKEKFGKVWVPVIPPAIKASRAVEIQKPVFPIDEKTLSLKLNKGLIKLKELKDAGCKQMKVDALIKNLKISKHDFKEQFGKDWIPDDSSLIALSNLVDETQETGTNNSRGITIWERIATQEHKVQELKIKNTDKDVIITEANVLRILKERFEYYTGKIWKSSALPATINNDITKFEEKLSQQIDEQSENVDQLIAGKAAHSVLQVQEDRLWQLKTDFATIVGISWETYKNKKSTAVSLVSCEPETSVSLPLKDESKAKKKDSNSPKSDAGTKSVKNPPKVGDIKEAKRKKNDSVVNKDDGKTKKITRLGLEALKEENLSDWYTQVITKAELIEYYDVSGCYILRPWAYSIWEAISAWFDAEIKKLGIQNCYFPIFVSKSVLEKEKDHIADFAPEVAWVTKSGESDLAEPIAVRPTSETVMYPAYAKWIQSYRDLPIKLNQWNNVVRWEFKHPQPFLRTREFLWQEGHTAYASKEDACVEVEHILSLYESIYKDLLAIPVLRGRKTEKEKFAGGEYTLTVEAYVAASGRAIQGATSHHLGQNFSKMFDIVYEDPDTQEKKYVYQNSWGITTRTIGVMVMTHGDNKGLILPPPIASVQVILIPCGLTVGLDPIERESIILVIKNLEQALLDEGIRAKGDYRLNYSPGWKFNHWELKGVPLRVEIGPADIRENIVVAVRRHDGVRQKLPRNEEIGETIKKLLDEIHLQLYERAALALINKTTHAHDFDIFKQKLEEKFIIYAPFCGEIACEDKIKADSARDDGEAAEPGAPAMGAKSLCIPLVPPFELKPSDKCIHPDCKKLAKHLTLFGRSY